MVTVRDEARPRQGHNDQSRRGHQCSETTLTGESWFHLSTPLGIEPGSLMTESKQVDHWTRETLFECSEIASSPKYRESASTRRFRQRVWMHKHEEKKSPAQLCVYFKKCDLYKQRIPVLATCLCTYLGPRSIFKINQFLQLLSSKFLSHIPC